LILIGDEAREEIEDFLLVKTAPAPAREVVAVETDEADVDIALQCPALTAMTGRVEQHKFIYLRPSMTADAKSKKGIGRGHRK
jgi:hypothetical protein